MSGRSQSDDKSIRGDARGAPREAPPELFSSALLATHGNRKRRATSFAVSIALQAAFLLTLAGILAVHPQIVQEAMQKQELYFPLKPPVATHVRITPPPRPKTPPPPTPVPVVVERVLPPPPMVERHIVEHHEVKVAPAPLVALSTPAPKLRPQPLPPAPPIKLNNLPVAAAVTTHRPAEQVQTGGFGDPQGAPGAQHSAQANMPKLGSFGMPEGPGVGNGTGGAHGVRGVVASSGFGDAGNGVGPGTGRSGGSVQLGGFGDNSQAATQPRARAAETQSPVTPVEILYKPDPQYTPEARQLRIEGEVLLNVVFEPSGQLTIVGVKRGLGHGLDEQAIAAARQIRFKPALRDGTPIETAAILHITFQIAE